ncbi:2'-5' RNA ligase family protein, partial [Roseovarius sp. SYSU LYC5161]|uniref:2'-5' RNA ligase family protein n=1 Tax=Roseovarius halophilus (ex Wu et al. 2025) TaxID=3376060 RepID=UPI003999FE31
LGREELESGRRGRAAGLDLPRARFRPHVTLTRLRPRPDPVERRKLDAALTELAGLHLPPARAAVLGLYRSQLTPGGAIHHELAAYPLAHGPAG